MVYSHNKYGLYISSGRGVYNQIYGDIWVFDFSADRWKQMDQGGYQTMRPRYGAAGGLYPSYEKSDPRINNFFVLHGQSINGQYIYQYMYGDLFKYSFTDLRSLNGIWQEGDSF